MARPPAPPVSPAAPEPSWFDEPNEAAEPSQTPDETGVTWIDPDAPAVPAPTQTATGIAWLDSPAPETQEATATGQDEDPFGWDPAEERSTALDAPPVPQSLEALKEVEPWALPGGEVPTGGADAIADALDRIAARIRSGDLVVPGASAATTDEALLASVLAALLYRAHG
ncbi:MAG: hypothetical protein ACT4PJ_01700 [Gemmatimonadaceae bacterium]